MTFLDASTLFVIRSVFVILLAVSAALLRPLSLSPLIGSAIGAACGLLTVMIEIRFRKLGLRSLIAGVLGMTAGAILGVLLVAVLAFSSLRLESHGSFAALAAPVCFAYIGLLVGLSKADLLNLSGGLFARENVSGRAMKILDTSVLIDGRVADIAESGFLEGQLVVPQFVIRELHMVADSSDSAKRNRGRRGLDVVQRLKKSANVDMCLVDEDVPQHKEVDLKLLELARIHRCPIMTNDFNLNKVAQVHGVQVLNINELANSLRPVVLPGECMRVFILKEGKEHNQGVAYLDDGTMVVVDNAKRHISKTIDVTVTSVLQTTAGKMIFGKYDERGGVHAGPEARIAIAPQFQHAAAGVSAASSK